MISRIKGEVIGKIVVDNENYIELYTSGGICYKVMVASRILQKVQKKEELEIFTSFQVREDSQKLYGFFDELEKKIFEMLINISGIGPKIGMAVLDYYDVKSLNELIREGDIEALKEVSGIGKKGAQKIILDLQDKMDFEDMVEYNVGSEPMATGVLGDLKKALQSLGFSGEDLKENLKYAKGLLKEDEDLSVEELISRVLQS